MFGITNSGFQKHLRCIFKVELVLFLANEATTDWHF